MGKIIGDKKKIAITFTQEEVRQITSDLNLKVVELTSKNEELTIENVKLNEEKEALQETINDLNLKVVELTSKNEKEKPEKGKKANEE